MKSGVRETEFFKLSIAWIISPSLIEISCIMLKSKGKGFRLVEVVIESLLKIVKKWELRRLALSTGSNNSWPLLFIKGGRDDGFFSFCFT